jgi:CBS domain-containing protein
MLRLRDIMTTDLVTLGPNLTIREAMEVFASRCISGAPVVAGGDVIGVISATDLISIAGSLPGVPTGRDPPPDVREDAGDSDQEAAGILDPDDDPSAVFFTELWDDAGASVVERMAEPATAEWNALEEHTVADAMTYAPIHSLTPETLVTQAAEYMGRAKIHRVLVMKGRELLGMVTTSDITRAVAEGKLTAHTYVFDRARPQGGGPNDWT